MGFVGVVGGDLSLRSHTFEEVEHHVENSDDCEGNASEEGRSPSEVEIAPTRCKRGGEEKPCVAIMIRHAASSL